MPDSDSPSPLQRAESVSPSGNVAFCKASRTHVRKRISTIYTKISREYDNLTVNTTNTYLNSVNKLEGEISRLNSEIAQYIFVTEGDSSNFARELEGSDSYEEKISESKSLLQAKIAELSVSVNNTSVTTPPSPSVDSAAPLNKLKLPEVPLPCYSHAKGETLLSFLSSFESIISKYTLSPHEKFVFLKRQLKGPPLTLIDSLDITEQKYDNATTLLRKAFASDTTQKFDIIRRMKDLKCTKPYEYVSEIKLIKDLFTNLNINSHMILQYFVWTGFTQDLQTQLITITNNNRPTLPEIEDNIFKAIDRLDELKSRTKNRDREVDPETCQAYAVNTPITSSNTINRTAYPFSSHGSPPMKSPIYCSICTEPNGSRISDHHTRHCQKFPTAEAKRKRLIEVEGCILCGLRNHSTKHCNYKFKQTCFHCRGLHMTFLCVGKPKGSFPPNGREVPKPQTPKSSGKVNSGVVWTHTAVRNSVGSACILPTFTGSVGGETIRIMKDSGCQPNFVTEKLAKKHNLQSTIENLSITIQGFNGPKIYKTREVELLLSLKNSSHNIRAIVVPNIKTKFSISCLPGIISNFKAKNYSLADSLLTSSSETVDNISMIVGTEASHVLRETQRSLGRENPSVFSETDEGVLIFGNSSKLSENLQYLGKRENVNPCSSNHVTLMPVNSNCVLSNHNSIVCNTNTITITDDCNFDKTLDTATDDILNSYYQNMIGLTTETTDESETDVNNKLISHTLTQTKRDETGRLIMPLAWKQGVSTHLGNNKNLALRILKSNERKLLREPDKLKLMDEAFKEQENLDIIERVDDDYLTQFPSHSYLPHMPVFKLDRETTKCRIVYLSNLCQKSQNVTTLSHNQVMHSGPCLNHKITTAFLFLRFDPYLLIFDMKKAFSQLKLTDVDSSKLLFFWYRNVTKGDFSLITFKHNRLPMGLRSSPFLLMLALYRILILDSTNDDEKTQRLKRLIYSLTYMDNAAVTGTETDVTITYNNLNSFFNPYGFEVQQVLTNSEKLQRSINSENGKDCATTTKLLGLLWNISEDTVQARQLNLDVTANTKRKVLQTIAGHFDPLGFQAPLLTRARLFMHSLQTNNELKWDDNLSNEEQKIWKLIAKQANKSPSVQLSRFVGNRNSTFSMHCFTDASRLMYAAVIYMMDEETKKVSFFLSKNRIVNTNLDQKTIPALELLAVKLGTEMCQDLRRELTQGETSYPINIVETFIYTDSQISLHWLNSYNVKLDKMQKHPVFIKNRLNDVAQLCESFPITYQFVSTSLNPADVLTRPCSYTQLSKSAYLNGETIHTLRDNSNIEILTVKVPPEENFSVASTAATEPVTHCNSAATTDRRHDVQLPIDLSRYSSFNKAVKILQTVLWCVRMWREKAKLGEVSNCKNSLENSKHLHYSKAFTLVLREAQQQAFPDILKFMRSDDKNLTEAPPLVHKFHIILDDRGLLRVKSKFGRFASDDEYSIPILLPKSSITDKLVLDTHVSMMHSGVYGVLSQLRKRYFLVHPFSSVRRALRDCVICKKQNSRSVKLNQNSYRLFRAKPKNIPFHSIFLDHLGPFYVKYGESKKKYYILILTCCWSRAVNLVPSPDLTVDTFMKAFQRHIFEFGIPGNVTSDMGSQLVAGANVIKTHLSSLTMKDFLAEHGINNFTFDQYDKGNSELGSLVEITVKLTKKLIHGAITKSVLSVYDFDFIIYQTRSLLNKRPITHHEALRDSSAEAPTPISPECLLYGRDLPIPNIIPGHESDVFSLSVSPSLEMKKLGATRNRLYKIYEAERQNTLVRQATDRNHRYKPVHHTPVKPGDVVLIKELNTKRQNFPLAVVMKVKKNSLNEVTGVTAKKGLTGELMKRHVSTIIPLISNDAEMEGTSPASTTENIRRLPPRAAKDAAKLKLQAME